MSIQIATKDDLERIVSFSLKFAAESDYKAYVEEESIRNLAQHLLNEPKEESIILLHEHGMLAAKVTPFIYGNIKVATELAWYIEPDQRSSSLGSDLMDAFEFWAKLVGCKLIMMSSLDDRVGKFYERKGYVLQERSYIKELN